MAPENPPFEPLMTTPEVAKVLRLTDKGIRDLIRGGTLRAVRVGRSWRVPRGALQAFLNDNATTTTEGATP